MNQFLRISKSTLGVGGRLGQSGHDCYAAMVATVARKLGASLNLTMKCWETLLPHVFCHPARLADLMPILQAYQKQHLGAMYSGGGGGDLIVVSEKPVSGAFQVNVRVTKK